MSAHIKVLGIYREERCSNRAIDADKAILDEVLNTFAFSLGQAVIVTRIRPEDIAHTVLDFSYNLVFSMAQEENILAYLDLLESRGSVVVNSSKAIRNCYRGRLSEKLSASKFSYPRYIPLKVEQVLFEIFDSCDGYWIKRGDFHSVTDDDVVHIKTIDELTEALDNFKNRGVGDVILQESIQGELFKFYGVRDIFFNLRYIGKTGHHRFTTLPGNADIKFDDNQLEKLVHSAANTLDLDFFGGDCIITEEGRIYLIDFNDWPSFRTCRKMAAEKMASYAHDKLKDGIKNANVLL